MVSLQENRPSTYLVVVVPLVVGVQQQVECLLNWLFSAPRSLYL